MRQERGGRVRTRNSSRGGARALGVSAQRFRRLALLPATARIFLSLYLATQAIRRRARAARSRSLRRPLRVAGPPSNSDRKRERPPGMEVAAAEWRLTRTPALEQSAATGCCWLADPLGIPTVCIEPARGDIVARACAASASALAPYASRKRGKPDALPARQPAPTPPGSGRAIARQQARDGRARDVPDPPRE